MQFTISHSFGLWWSKVGKWQASAVPVTLAIYFITLYLTDDDKIAGAGFAALGAFVVAFVAGIMAALAEINTSFTDADVLSFEAYSAAFATALAGAAFVAFIAAFIGGFGIGVFAIGAVASVGFAVFCCAAFADKMAKYRISKKATWLSSAAEFTLILVPMLITILG